MHGCLSRSPYYYIDMELCDLSLETVVQGDWERIMTNVGSRTFNMAMEIKHVWYIMENVTRGLTFIHDLGEVHRDLKPSNGTLFTL